MLDRAFTIAGWAHRGQTDASCPKPYLGHCVEVVEILSGHGVEDDRTLAAALC
jgi:(p)ppGpp synthase/HD superfamily hydrolase